MKPHIIRTASFITDTSAFIVQKIDESIQARGRCILGLCGGSTPKPVYAEIARTGLSIDWTRVVITFGDERCVKPDDQESNYRMAREQLLDKIPIPNGGVHRIHGELPPEDAARAYEDELAHIAGSQKVLVHDLMLLGLGNDGHTASIFPGTDACREKEHTVVANLIPQLRTFRISCTYPLINSSRNVCFMVNDPKKNQIIDAVLAGDQAYPASFVTAAESLTWIIGE